MTTNRTYGDELADVFVSFAIEKNPTGLSVGIDSAYELGDHIESDWLAEHDRQVAERAWDEGVRFDRCVCAAWNEDECACGRWGTVPRNPYRSAP